MLSSFSGVCGSAGLIMIMLQVNSWLAAILVEANIADKLPCVLTSDSSERVNDIDSEYSQKRVQNQFLCSSICPAILLIFQQVNDVIQSSVNVLVTG